jgi:hypothetical protein
MKNKIILSLAILVGIGMGSVITACSNISSQTQANENDYLKYCGKQRVFNNGKYVEVYEDIQHKKVVYVGSDGFEHPITISVSDLK